MNFPSFSEGLSLREWRRVGAASVGFPFPFLFGGTFIEGPENKFFRGFFREFPFLFGGTFIEGSLTTRELVRNLDFPSFSEGLSLRVCGPVRHEESSGISLPFRRDFH